MGANVSLAISIGVFIGLLAAMFVIGVEFGKYRTRMRLLDVIKKMPNDLNGGRYEYIIKNIRVYLLHRIDKEEKKWIF